jgi:hypothetical protein
MDPVENIVLREEMQRDEPTSDLSLRSQYARSTYEAEKEKEKANPAREKILKGNEWYSMYRVDKEAFVIAVFLVLGTIATFAVAYALFGDQPPETQERIHDEYNNIIETGGGLKY